MTEDAEPLAIAEWREVLGDPNVLTGLACDRYGATCTGARPRIIAVIRPASEDEIIRAVRVSRARKIPLYPISTGHNWGYGSATPVVDDCVIMDLSRMDRVVEFEESLGLATLQPGVTQQGLADFLDQRGLAFMVPTTGAGPQASLVGNALERGFGITPFADHFGAVTRLRAILPDGRVYQSAHGQASSIDRAYKWGVGPYLDGLFSQGAFGIVTEATIVLARRPPAIELLMFDLAAEDRLPHVVEVVRDLTQRFPGCLGPVNLLNRLRLLSMTAPYPSGSSKPGEALPATAAEAVANELGLPPWMGVAALYGTPGIVSEVRFQVRKALKPHCRRIVVLSRRRVDALTRIAAALPPKLRRKVRPRLEAADQALQVLSGRPREIALSLAYWRGGNQDPAADRLDPARDGCGLIWYAPLVPMKHKDVTDFLSMVETVCRAHGFDPLVTLTALSGACFDCTVPLLYDPQVVPPERAQDCFTALFEAGERLGYMPYRMSTTAMGLYTDRADSSFWSLVATFKRAIDPDDLLSPGRYSAPPAPGSRREAQT